METRSIDSVQECPICSKLCKSNILKRYNLIIPPLVDPSKTSHQVSLIFNFRNDVTATYNNEIQGNKGHSLDIFNQKSESSEQTKSNIQARPSQLPGYNVPISMKRSLIIETIRSELSSLNTNNAQHQSNSNNFSVPSVSLLIPSTPPTNQSNYEFNPDKFESSLFREFAIVLGSKVIHITLFHPQTNGQFERCHRAIKCHGNTKWTDVLPLVLFGLKSSVNADTPYVRAELVYVTTLLPPGQFEASKT
uniref:Integrase catalytic domain-containing protein n=1 Tax=Glossina austeni TaxID=7395 RepID=A0A1A9UDA1_GLOAU